MNERGGRPRKAQKGQVPGLQGRLRELAGDLRWTQDRMARAADVTPATVTQWLRKKDPATPNAVALRNLALKSGYSLNWLILGPPHPKTLTDAANVNLPVAFRAQLALAQANLEASLAGIQASVRAIPRLVAARKPSKRDASTGRA